MKTAILLISLLLLASSVFAIIEPGDNMMGFYFDNDFDSTTITEVPSFTLQTMYLVLVHPTFDYLYGFEFGYSIDGPGLILSTVYTNPNIIDVGSSGNHIVGFGDPSPMSEASILATLGIIYTDPDGCEPLFFHLHGTYPSSINPLFPTMLLADGELFATGVSDWGGFTSAVFGDCTVSTTSKSLDEIKSLYR